MDEDEPFGYLVPERTARERWGCAVGGTLLALAVLGMIAGGAFYIIKKFPYGGIPVANAGATNPDNGPTGAGAAAQPPSVESQAKSAQLTARFLHAWAVGDIGQAAALTDDPPAAQAALAAYRKGLSPKKLVLTPDAGSLETSDGNADPKAQGATAVIQYQVTARVTVAAGGVAGVWTYRTQLVTYQSRGAWHIDWEADDLAPNLTPAYHLAVVAVPGGKAPTATDNKGNALTDYADPGLSEVAALIEPRAATTKGKPGLAIAVEDANNKPRPGLTATITEPGTAKAATTINESAEAAARNAVESTPGSALVAIQPSTGHILAIANNAGDNDFALTAQVAPGSVGKIITAAALLNAGTVTESTHVDCPATETVGGQTFRNDAGETEPPGTPFATDFAMSCNNAFTQFEPHLTRGYLAATAQDYFGLGVPWTLGLAGGPAAYFSAPTDPGAAELAQESFGEGLLTTCPLAMASVAATVDTGQFHQPELVPGSVTAGAFPLPAATDRQLQDMMRDVVTEGTAASVGFGPDVYAKTGTADISGQDQPNAWLTAYDPAQDVAVAALVLNAGDGAAVAGPLVKSFLDQY